MRSCQPGCGGETGVRKSRKCELTPEDCGIKATYSTTVTPPKNSSDRAGTQWYMSTGTREGNFPEKIAAAKRW
jgi:hypothetical protein